MNLDAVDTWWRDRHGNPITRERCEQLRQDPSYRQVADTEVPGGDDVVFRVSTVWRGSYSNAEGPPEIFETMVFVNNADGTPMKYCAEMMVAQYSTVDEAQQGHLDVVSALAGTFQCTGS